jgi:hypothetical protein
MVIVRTADRTRKAEVTIPRDQRASDLIQSAVTNWSLPAAHNYSLVNATRRSTIPGDALLSSDVVGERDELEVQPVLVAGAVDGRRC